jgi:hypothetical protein
MIKSTIKFMTAVIAVYGAYKAVSDFLETDAGAQVKEYVDSKIEDISAYASSVKDKAKVNK